VRLRGSWDAEWLREGVAQSRPWVDHIVAVSESVRRAIGDDARRERDFNGVDSEHLACACSREQMRESLGFLRPTSW